MDDLNDIFRVVDTTGWGETKEDIRRMIANPDNKYILLISPENEIIAVTLTIQCGKIGFIGHVIVMPEFRGMGIGQEIMIEAINYLEFHGCTTIMLDAVQKAKSLYERVGFTFKMNSYRYFLDISTEEKKKALESLFQKKAEEDLKIFNTKDTDLQEILALDQVIFGCNRENLLIDFFEFFPESAFYSRDEKDEISGYCFGEFKDNTLYIRAGISNSLLDTTALIESIIVKANSKYKLEFVKIGLLENSVYGLPLIKKLGFKETSYSLRMFYGEETDVSFNPQIFAIGHPAKG